MKTFEDWFFEINGYTLRAEWFYVDVTSVKEGKSEQSLVQWLRAAYEAGQESQRKNHE